MVTEAATKVAIVSASSLAALALLALLNHAADLVLPAAVAAATVPLALRELVLGRPQTAARRRAEEVLKDSTHATNLMIMSLGHEPSISRALRFASRADNSFSEELRGCVWSVVMGRYSSFEEALHALGTKWARFSGDLKASINAMVTASCEATEEGKRRALDRANNAMMMGAKRRIEEYALSLSTPSMIMFGLGILLPLMVGSFLPMLSWNLWSFEGLEEGGVRASGNGGTLETIFLMNVLFPALAFLVASNAVTHHPLETRGGRSLGGLRLAGVLVASALTAGGVTASVLSLQGVLRSAACLLSCCVPVGVWMTLEGMKGRASTHGLAVGVEDALFVTGARMLEGENFEAALGRAASDLSDEPAQVMRNLSFRSNIAGRSFDTAVEQEAESTGRSNALEAFKVVQEAAVKDEARAGLLAMDLAAYLKDLHDLEDTLKGRLKPTISMMRMTAYVLGPIVMGVTFAIFISMGSIMGDVPGGLDPELFLFVLGAFLAETSAIVSYFVWGIEGKGVQADLAFTVGTSIIASELIFSATSILATG